ncbi:hypothetical protein ELOC111193_16725 [Elizabethkingia occulta]|uniref:Uncharacterized protein n=1 Tax=Elizabethkingia occulta TaxID=1867263 RepID=A0A1T3M981_9FLAO|nr:hypothetical protein [Elizabethkingia occulta]OPB86484.1 hypothetical protein BB020_06105 [Elizabethkingia occulta]OPC61165.1 hypothetical protein BAZ10_11925 [Elizabethkingia occulta]
MMEKNETNKDNSKKEYLPPTVTMDLIEMEYGIAANSVIVAPKPDNTQTEWEHEDTQEVPVIY